MMDLEIIGLLHPHERSETHHAEGAIIDAGYVTRLARAYEASGFDRILVGSSSSGPDSLQMAAFAAAQTESLGFMVAHRPGFIAPTVAARAFATLDQFARGRIALHTITGRDDAEQRADGDYLDKTRRYARSGEYLRVLKKAWTHQGPFDFEGEFYRFEHFTTDVKPYHPTGIPIYFAGASDAAFAVGAREADTYMFYAQPLKPFAEDIARVRAEAQLAGRAVPPRFGLIVRPILADTDEAAWARADTILRLTEERVAKGKPMMRGSKDMDPSAAAGVSDRRQLEHHARGARHDRALWTAVTGATLRGNSTALVGSPETVARALRDYVGIGVTTLLIHGFDPYDDAVDFGRQLVPLLRQTAWLQKAS
jgi:alkanesulfonate monooxygenase